MRVTKKELEFLKKHYPVTMGDCDRPKFYECGICGAYHRAEWNGDCREDAERFDELPDNAVLVEMEDL